MIKIILFIFSICINNIFATPKNETTERKLYPNLDHYVKLLKKSYPDVGKVSNARLKVIGQYIKYYEGGDKPVLVFLDTESSTVSQLLKVWAETASYHYEVDNVHIMYASENGESMEYDAVKVLEKIGFIVYKTEIDGYSRFEVKYAPAKKPLMMDPVFVSEIVQFLPESMGVYVNSKEFLSESVSTVSSSKLEYVHPDWKSLNEQIALEMFYLFAHLRNKAEYDAKKAQEQKKFRFRDMNGM
ncbi:hypothetical protein [Aureibacter tunicatorum]|uniref:Uncharacterized protein n=1 Tax=Aureibacter tunicatorum TaxID=866807 RepID=A0AAE4BUN6_9BACT|nr:hypothetical protein [Aureibacter tunicatorum]MDR6240987.1 hypothetical protein [Aureibacter tunicatorum]BDD03766.1 hypothetical protein AUTU_12490 [Aureibacter tunicatorum]